MLYRTCIPATPSLIMGFMARDSRFLEAKDKTLDNLLQLRTSLNRCIEEGMIDTDDHYYNEVVDLLSDAEIVTDWDELMEIITLAKILEVDVSAWLARKGQTSLSMQWPKPPIYRE